MQTNTHTHRDTTAGTVDYRSFRTSMIRVPAGRPSGRKAFACPCGQERVPEPSLCSSYIDSLACMHDRYQFFVASLRAAAS